MRPKVHSLQRGLKPWELMAQEKPEELRAALLLTMEAIHCVVVKRGLTRLCACQVGFKNSDARRYYIIRYTQGHGAGVGRSAKPTWGVKSDAELAKLDLRKPAAAKAMEVYLQSIPLAELP